MNLLALSVLLFLAGLYASRYVLEHRQQKWKAQAALFFMAAALVLLAYSAGWIRQVRVEMPLHVKGCLLYPRPGGQYDTVCP